MLIKALMVWAVIAAGEIINGNIRVRLLQRRYGIHRAKQLSLFTGIVIFSAITWLSLSWVGPADLYQCFGIGLTWTALMILLDIYFGKFIFHYSWRRIAEDFNPKKGNLLGAGMLLLFFCPAIIFLLQR